MKSVKVITIIGAIALSFAIAFAAGNAENGKKLFNDPTLGGSTNSKSCNTCHPGGQRLENAGTREFTSFMRQDITSLEEVINMCVTGPLNGKALAVDSQKMQDIVAYIKTLGK